MITNEKNSYVLLIDEILTQVDCFSYLGVKLDAHLTWNEKVDDMCKKLVFMVSRLRRLKSVLEPRILMYIYNSIIIQPRIDYAICAWGFTTNQNLSKVKLLQNRAARNWLS